MNIISHRSSVNLDETIFVYCDGGARGNPGPAAIGFVVRDSKENIINESSKFIGKATNNMAEYQAVVAVLNWLGEYHKKFKFKEVRIYLDSNLVVNQLNAKFKIKNSTLKKLAIKVGELENSISAKKNTNDEQLLFQTDDIKLSYQYIPRENNTKADELVNQALDQNKCSDSSN